MKNLNKFVVSFVSSTLFAGLISVVSLQVSGQEIGAWETSSNNAGQGISWSANPSIWQTNTGSGFVIPGGNTPSFSYPDTNTTTITLLPGAFVTNSGALSANQLTVSNGATLNINSGMAVLHNTATTYDWDIYGNLGLGSGSAGSFNLTNSAVIAIESGGTVTNFTATVGDIFGNYNSTNLLFLNGSLYVMTGIKVAGSGSTLPQATWSPNSTMMYAPPNAGTKFPSAFTNQTYGIFIWNWPSQSGSTEPSTKGGNVNFANTFAVYAANGNLLEDIPGPGYTMNAGNVLITNCVWEPLAGTAGSVNVNISGDLIIDKSAAINVANSGGIGNFTFNGTAPQILGIFGTNSSQAAFNWMVDSGATVQLGSNLTINVNGTVAAGTFTNNGWLDLESWILNDASNLCGSGVVSNSTGSAVLDAGSGSFTGNIVGGAGVISVGKFGPATWILSGANTYSGNTTVGAGTLALTGSATIPDTTNILVNGSATFNVSGLSSTFTLGAAQILSNNPTNTPGMINGAFNAGSGTISLSYTSASTPLAITNGTLTLASGTTVRVFNTGPALAAGVYTLITNLLNGSVAGTLPSVTVGGGGIAAGTSASLQISSGALDLVVTSAAQSVPAITSIKVSGTTLTISATNGTDGGQYVLLGTTNLNPPVVWTPIFTNNFNGSGDINSLSTNIVNPNIPAEFYILQQP